MYADYERESYRRASAAKIATRDREPHDVSPGGFGARFIAAIQSHSSWNRDR